MTSLPTTIRNCWSRHQRPPLKNTRSFISIYRGKFEFFVFKCYFSKNFICSPFGHFYVQALLAHSKKFSLIRRLKRTGVPEIYYGKTGVDLPVLQLEPLSATIRASHTGPDGGLTEVAYFKHIQPVMFYFVFLFSTLDG